MTLTLKDLGVRLGNGTATIEDLKGFDPKDVVAMKQDLRYTMRTTANAISPTCVFPASSKDAKAAKAGKKPKKEEGKGELLAALEDGVPIFRDYAATVQVVDRLGDLVMTRETKGPEDSDATGEGFRTDVHLASGGAFLWSHMSSSPAIGQVSDPRQRRIDTALGRLWATIETVRYIPDDRIPFSVPAVILLDAGVCKAVSVGFVGVKIWRPDDEKVRQKLGLPRYGVVFMTSDQTELSQAQTPANQLALLQEGQKYVFVSTERAVDETLKRAVEEGRMPESLRLDFVRECSLGPEDEADRLASKVNGFFDMVGELRGIDFAHIEEGEDSLDFEIERDLEDDEDVEERSADSEEPNDDLDEIYNLLDIEDGDGSVQSRAIAAIEALQESRTLDTEPEGELSAPSMAISETIRSQFSTAFETISRATEILAGIEDVLDGIPIAADKGVDFGSGAPQDQGGLAAVARSIALLAESVVTSGQRSTLEEDTSGGPGDRSEGGRTRASAGEESETDLGLVLEAELGDRTPTSRLSEG